MPSRAAKKRAKKRGRSIEPQIKEASPSSPSSLLSPVCNEKNEIGKKSKNESEEEEIKINSDIQFSNLKNGLLSITPNWIPLKLVNRLRYDAEELYKNNNFTVGALGGQNDDSSHHYLQSKTRKRHIVQARQIAMFFAKKLTKASLASIGKQIGDRDHATVLHACRTVNNLTETDKRFRTYVEDLRKKLTLK